jgi:cysteine desulfuration protein SufE
MSDTTVDVVTDDLPDPLAEIVTEFLALPQRQRLELLLEFSRELPRLPDRLAAERDAMEPVVECQSPLFLLVELDSPGRADSPVRLHFDAPAEAPTTRGFASILYGGLDGLTAEQVAAVPDDVPQRLGLTGAVSPLRLTGMAGMLTRIKRQVRARAGLPGRAPTSEAPTSQGPTSQGPTSQAPTSQAPTSDASTSDAPTGRGLGPV